MDGDVRQTLGQFQVLVVEGSRSSPEQSECARAGHPASRMGMACTEAKPCSAATAVNRGHRCVCGAQVGDADRFTGLVTVQAGSLVALQLEGLELARFLGGRRQQVQHPTRVGEQQTHRGDVQQPCAILGEFRGQVQHVDVVDQPVGEPDERLDDVVFSLVRSSTLASRSVLMVVVIEIQVMLQDLVGDLAE